jgi:hypothetical protein
MKLRPGEYQSFLAPGKRPGNPFDWLHAVNPDVILIIGVKMR